MGFEDFADIVKENVETLIKCRAVIFEANGTFKIKILLKEFDLIYDYNLFPFYVEGLYPWDTASIIRDKIIENIHKRILR